MPQDQCGRKTAALCLVHSGRQNYRLARRRGHRSVLQGDIRALQLAAASRAQKGWPLTDRSCQRRSLDLAANGAPKWLGIVKAYLAQPGIFHQCLDLCLGHAMLDACAEAVERVGTHGIVAAPAICTERPMGDIAAKPLTEMCTPRKGPIDAGSEKFGKYRFDAKRCPRQRLAKKVACSPERTKPRRPVVKGVVDIDEHRCSALEFPHARGKASR